MEINPEGTKFLEMIEVGGYVLIGVIVLLFFLWQGGVVSWFRRRIIQGGNLPIEERLRQAEGSYLSEQDNDDDKGEEDSK